MNYRANDALASASISEPVKEKKQTQSDTIKMDDAIESLFDD